MLTADDVNDDLLKSRMATKILPPVDLLIRTGGEKRLSNFLLWGFVICGAVFQRQIMANFASSDCLMR